MEFELFDRLARYIDSNPKADEEAKDEEGKDEEDERSCLFDLSTPHSFMAGIATN